MKSKTTMLKAGFYDTIDAFISFFKKNVTVIGTWTEAGLADRRGNLECIKTLAFLPLVL